MNAISLQFYASTDELSSFLVVECEKPERLDLFTPHFMQWQENIWIFDLKSCRTYWQNQARKKGIALHQLLHELLDQAFPDAKALLTPHPWPGLLLLSLMKERGLTGLLLWEASYTQALYRSISWGQWFAQARLMAQVSGLDHHLLAFKKSIDRLGLDRPWDFKDMPKEQLQRRYGKVVGSCWSWTFPEPPKENSQLSLFDQSYPYDLNDFPWKTYSQTEPAQAHRLLEYPVVGWENIKDFLIEDLDKLCSHPELPDTLKVCELEWKILLSNFKELTIPVSFHSPLHLHSEKAEHKSSLSQFYFAYEKAMAEIKVRDEDLDLPLQIPFVSWEIRVSHHFRASGFSSPLIKDSITQAQLQIQDLSNKLPAPLVCYSLYPDFCPENSFRPQIWQQQEEEELLESWKQAAKRRPLFIFKKPKRLPRSAFDSAKFFLERSSETWWETGESQLYFRDYFLVQNKDRKWLWAYRTPQGRWFQHGLYT